MASHKLQRDMTCGDIQDILKKRLQPLFLQQEGYKAQRDELLAAAKKII